MFVTAKAGLGSTEIHPGFFNSRTNGEKFFKGNRFSFFGFFNILSGFFLTDVGSVETLPCNCNINDKSGKASVAFWSKTYWNLGNEPGFNILY